MKKLLFITTLLFSATLFAQKKQPYIIYDAKGKKTSYEKMMKRLADKDILLFGEYHNNAIAHWLQLEVTKDLKEKRELVLGAEMFEQDNQEALDMYLAGTIKQKQLDSMARLWKNYPTDYAPLVNFAKENKIAFAATNVPRRYASMVSRGGFSVLDTITAKEKTWMAPLPIAYDAELPGYKKMIEMMGGHGGENLPKAQALKDATMAHFILKYHRPGTMLIHYNGAYHSDYYDGINWYLKKQNPAVKIVTISTVSQKNIHLLDKEHVGKADFIICVDEDMTNTY